MHRSVVCLAAVAVVVLPLAVPALALGLVLWAFGTLAEDTFDVEFPDEDDWDAAA